MDQKLRDDLQCIILEEAYGMHERYARKLLADGSFRVADAEAMDGSSKIVNRIIARCSRIEG